MVMDYNSTNINKKKRTITSPLKSLNTENTTAYADAHLSPGLRQAQEYLF